jgi:hypothetical protein
MMTRLRIGVLAAWSGGIGAGVILLIVIVQTAAGGTSGERLTLEVGPWVGVSIDPRYCEMYGLIGGDGAFPDWWIPTWRSRIHLGSKNVFIELREAVGVPVSGRRVCLHAATWFLLILLPLPALWRWAARRRAREAALVGCCMQCGYDLRASGDCCPECGCPRSEHRPPPPGRRFTGFAVVSFTVCMMLLAQAIWPSEIHAGPWSIYSSDTQFHFEYQDDLFLGYASLNETVYVDSLGVELKRWWTSPAGGSAWSAAIAKLDVLTLSAILPALWLMKWLRFRRQPRSAGTGNAG